jgi:transposase
MIRLNAQGWNAPAIAEIFECCEHTVRATLKRWQDNGVNGLWDAYGRGCSNRRNGGAGTEGPIHAQSF